jgi:hypothetical protein
MEIKSSRLPGTSICYVLVKTAQYSLLKRSVWGCFEPAEWDSGHVIGNPIGCAEPGFGLLGTVDRFSFRLELGKVFFLRYIENDGESHTEFFRLGLDGRVRKITRKTAQRLTGG